MEAISNGKLSVDTLIPIPIIIASIIPLSKSLIASLKIPQTFFPR